MITGETLPLRTIIDDFASAFKAVDEARPQGSSRTRTYKPGIGPLAEADAIDRTLQLLQVEIQCSSYETASPKRYPSSRRHCDLVIPGEWAIEFKLLRPFGDNGKEAEHWSENVLHPYQGNISAIGDCIKLIESGFPERKAVVVFGYEHSPPQIDITPAIESFEIVAKEVVGVQRFGGVRGVPGQAPHGATEGGSVL